MKSRKNFDVWDAETCSDDCQRLISFTSVSPSVAAEEQNCGEPVLTFARRRLDFPDDRKTLVLTTRRFPVRD
ncbi:MAG: hypothetical protein EA381_12930 [Planctomycetaceae bacterium]|nr:MAG: hypothetical protein EA381_12930 [Planctomycetaceae bacterium]